MDDQTQNPAINYDEIEAELKMLRQEYQKLRTQTNQTINDGVGHSDQLHADDLRQKIGLAPS
jgi:flagellar biosynthesis chaperone FliJ